MKYDHSIVETDNFGSDYPDESFLIQHLPKETCEKVASLINDALNPKGGQPASRFYKVVEDTYRKPYKLQPGFEP